MQNLILNVAIPSTVLEDCNDLRSKTQKLGQIARACAIFKVKKIIIYSFNKIISKDIEKNNEFIRNILEYLDCPQYLRKIIYPKLPIFRYVGILPPLQTPNHPLENKITKITKNSIREGVVLYSNDNFSEIEMGVEKPIKIEIPNLPKKSRIILKFKRQGNTLSWVPIEKRKIKEYWGYDVQIFKQSIKKFIKEFSDYIFIGTSRKGASIKKENLNFFQNLGEKNKILLLFGSPNMGLFEIFKKNHLNLEDWANFIINITPEQGTKTIRIEEALISSLTIVNLLICL